MILAVSNFIFKTPARVTNASSDTFQHHQTYKKTSRTHSIFEHPGIDQND